MDERRRLLSQSPKRANESPTHIQLPFWRMQIACGLILMTVILERLAFYGLSGNLVLFLNTKPYGWESYHALNAMFYFLGLSYVTPLFGGWLADSIIGHYKAILVAFVIYIAGYSMMPMLAPMSESSGNRTTASLPKMCLIAASDNSSFNNNTPSIINSNANINNPFDENCAWLIYLVLTVIAIGAGAAKANIAPMGADQVVGGGQQSTLVFFNWFYWCINLGAFIGLGVMTYIEQQHNFFYGYLSAGSALACAALLFLFGGCVFLKKPASGSVLTNIFRILREACKSRSRNKKLRLRTERHVDVAGSTESDVKFLDYAKHRHGGIFHDFIVDDVRELKKIMCVFVFLIPYWIVYFQMQTTFLLQGLHMKLLVTGVDMNSSLNTSSVVYRTPQIVAAWLSLFDAIILIVMLPLVDRVIYPRLAKAGYPFTMTKRMIFGMVFAMAAMCVAGLVEHYRLQSFWPSEVHPCRNNSIIQHIGVSEYQAANMSIFWQIPQYVLIGLSEVFTSIAGLQFAFSMAPKSMKGIIMGLFYFMSGIGSFIGTGIISGLNAYGIWFVDGNDHGDINCRMPCSASKPYYINSQSCHLDYYFFFLAGVELLGLVLFVIMSKVLHLEQDQHKQMPLQLPAGDNVTCDQDSPPIRSFTHSIQRTVSTT